MFDKIASMFEDVAKNLKLMQEIITTMSKRIDELEKRQDLLWEGLQGITKSLSAKEQEDERT